MAADESQRQYPLNDYEFLLAKSEEEILAWANGDSSFSSGARFDSVRTERIEIDGENRLVLLVTRPMATPRIEIHVHVRHKQGWGLVLVRRTNTAEVKVEVDKTAKQILFRSLAERLLLVLPVENVDIEPTWIEQRG